MKLHLKSRPGFTLIELIGVIVIIMILVSVVLVVNGSSRQRALDVRISADMEAITTAKSTWLLDHPGQSFPAAEADRYTAIKRYLDPVQASSTLSAYAPDGVTYTIGSLSTTPSHSP